MQLREKSCGAVVYTRIGDELYFVIVQHRGGHFGFPKGHCEAGECEVETALREIHEETGLRPVVYESFRMLEEYALPYQRNTLKQVVYFLAEFKHQHIRVDEVEMLDVVLLRYEDALASLHHEGQRDILRAAHAQLTRDQGVEKDA